ncbi:hypothetical protein DFH29DRAFT_264238 [Suillus ampliporus]|nr:hypothetical protein DFH29DRAFT_264238 [Suillus ampliporus]
MKFVCLLSSHYPYLLRFLHSTIMSLSEIEERKDLINLLLLIGLTLTPHFILKIPTYLNLNVGDIEWLSSYGALFTVLLVADTYTSLSQTQSWLGNRAGSLIQFLNWLVIWAGLIYFIFPELDQNTVSAWLLSVIIVVVLESIFWVFVGVEREREHLHAYGQLHRWLHINVMNFLKCMNLSILERNHILI